MSRGREGLERQGEETVQECALSLQCELQVFEKHSPKETAGGRGVLAAEVVGHNYSPLSKSSLSTQAEGESNSNHAAHLRPQILYITYGI